MSKLKQQKTMRNFIKCGMTVAVAALSFVGCTKDLASDVEKKEAKEGFVIGATLDETRVVREGEGKLAWELTDQMGIFVKQGEALLGANLQAITTEELLAKSEFSVENVESIPVGSTLYAIYPYSAFADKGSYVENVLTAPSVEAAWVCLNQSQVQSAIDVCDATKYMTMLSAPVVVEEGVKPTLTFHAVSSILGFDIYGKNDEAVQSVQVIKKGGDPTPLTGSYQCDLTNGGEFNILSSIKRMAGIVTIDEPKAGPGMVYMAVFPGEHLCEVIVTTDKGVYVFNFIKEFNCTQTDKVGTVRLNLAHEGVKKYLVYQTFDQMIWGGDIMYSGENGYVPGVKEDGTVLLDSKENGETPYIAPGAAQGSSDGSVNFGGATAEYLRARYLTGWSLSKVYEHPGFIKMGTSTAGVWYVKTPVLSSLQGTDNALKVSFDIARRHSAPGTLKLEIEGAGMFANSETSAVLDVDNPASWDKVREEICHFEYIVFNASSETRISITSPGDANNRAYLDNIFVEEYEVPFKKLDVPTSLDLAEYAPFEVDSEVGKAIAVRWITTDDNVCAGYEYVVKVNNEVKKSGTVLDTRVSLDPIFGQTINSIKLNVRALGVEGLSGDSDWTGETELYDSNILFVDDLEWITAERYKPDWAEWSDNALYLLPTAATTTEDGKLQLAARGLGWENNYSYAHIGAFKVGRAKDKTNHSYVSLSPYALSELGSSTSIKFTLELGAPTSTNDPSVVFVGIKNGSDATIQQQVAMKPTVTATKVWFRFEDCAVLEGATATSKVTIGNDVIDGTYIYNSTYANRFAVGYVKIVKNN